MHTEYLPCGYQLICPPEVFPLGQDSMLLAHFAKVPRRAKVLDIGCGAGVLALSLLGKSDTSTAIALDYDPVACQTAADNAKRNGITERMQVLCADVRHPPKELLTGRMDIAVCNPPYFLNKQGKTHSKVPQARQEDGTVLPHCIHLASRALHERGRLFLVYRPERLASLFALLYAHRLSPKRMQMVQQTIRHAPSAVLLEAIKDGGEGLAVLPPFIIQHLDGTSTDEYTAVYTPRKEMPCPQERFI